MPKFFRVWSGTYVLCLLSCFGDPSSLPDAPSNSMGRPRTDSFWGTKGAKDGYCPSFRGADVEFRPASAPTEAFGADLHDLAADFERSGRRRRGYVEHVQHPVRGHDLKVVHQGSVPLQRLRAHARAARDEIIRCNFRDQLLQSLHEGGLRHRALDLAESVAPVFCRHSPESRESQRRNQVAHANVEAPVAFALEGKDGIGAGVDPACDASRKMHAQKRKLRIRYGIDECANQRVTFGNKIVILTTKGNDGDC